MTPAFDRPRWLIPHPRHLRRRRTETVGLTAADLEAVAAWLGTPFSGPAVGVGGSSRGDNVTVRIEDGLLLLKRYKNTVSEAMVEQEHSVLRHLETSGFPAPRLKRSRQGTTAIERAGRWFAAFDYIDGGTHYHHYLWTPARLRDLISNSGASLARLHQTLGAFIPSGSNPDGFGGPDEDRDRNAAWYLDQLAEATNTEAGVPEKVRIHLEGLSDSFVRLDSRLAEASPPRQLIHGDYGPYNLLLVPDQPMIVLDFEMARVDWRVTDIAKSIQQFAVTRRGLSLSRLRAFLGGYQQVNPLSPAEMRLVPAVWEYVTLRRLIVYWHRFCQTGEPRWLAQTERKADLVELIRNQSGLLDLECNRF